MIGLFKNVYPRSEIFYFFLFTVDSLLLSDLGNNGESFHLIVNLGVSRCLVLFWFFHFFLIQYWFPRQCILENFQLEKITKRLHRWTSRQHVYILLYVTHLYIESGTCVIMHGCKRTSFSDEHKKHKESSITYRSIRRTRSHRAGIIISLCQVLCRKRVRCSLWIVQ